MIRHSGRPPLGRANLFLPIRALHTPEAVPWLQRCDYHWDPFLIRRSLRNSPTT